MEYRVALNALFNPKFYRKKGSSSFESIARFPSPFKYPLIFRGALAFEGYLTILTTFCLDDFTAAIVVIPVHKKYLIM